jgi:hypothetical protein
MAGDSFFSGVPAAHEDVRRPNLHDLLKISLPSVGGVGSAYAMQLQRVKDATQSLTGRRSERPFIGVSELVGTAEEQRLLRE